MIVYPIEEFTYVPIGFLLIITSIPHKIANKDIIPNVGVTKSLFVPSEPDVIVSHHQYSCSLYFLRLSIDTFIGVLTYTNIFH